MNKLFFAIVVLCVVTRTCYADAGPEVVSDHLIFVSSVVDPNDHEIDELKNLMASPLIGINETDKSLMMKNNCIYEIIFSSEPENIITIPATDRENYSMSYFENLVKTRTEKRKKGASLKGLRKALEISSKFSQEQRATIALVTNTEPEDGYLLNEILDTMMMEINSTTVFILQIDKNTSIFNPPPSNDSAYEHIGSHNATNLDKVMYHIIHTQTNETLGREYTSIKQITTNKMNEIFLNMLRFIIKGIFESFKESFRSTSTNGSTHMPEPIPMHIRKKKKKYQRVFRNSSTKTGR